MNDQWKIIMSRYQRAQAILKGCATRSMVRNDTLFPHWIENSECFWYERATKQGREFRLVNAIDRKNEAAFDHGRLASALAQASGKTIDSEDLPVNQVSIKLSPLRVSFLAFERHWIFDVDKNQCNAVPESIVSLGEELSPDGKRVAFIRDHNLWLRDVNSGEEWAVTFDGVEDYSYGGHNSAWGMSLPVPDQPVLWSPDSKSLLVILRDKRNVQVLPIIDHVPDDGSLRPVLTSTKVAYPGDDHVETFQFLAINTISNESHIANYPSIPAGLNNNALDFFSRIAWWGKDSHFAYFIALERGDRKMHLVEFDTKTGCTRVIFEEESKSHINILTSDVLCSSAHRILADSNELVWWSERNGWGHLYLYDLESGELKNSITEGNWSVRDVVHVDELRRELIIQTSGRSPDRDAYYRDICRVQIDTGKLTTLYSIDEDSTVHYPESLVVLLESFSNRANAQVQGVAPGGEFLIVTHSRVDQEPKTILLNRDGEEILELESTDVSSLPTDWTWPKPIQVLASDEKTPLYGVLYYPSDFSPDKSYPVIDHTSGAPWLSMVPKGSFNDNHSTYTCMHYFHGAALAELGFIVLQLDSRGTALRGKVFQDESYGWVPDACNSEDHVYAIKQLAKRFPYMDLNRVGSFSLVYHSGLVNYLKRQDFYKVHVQASLMEERFVGSNLSGDKYQGCDGAERENAEDLAKDLTGKLLLIHPMQGTMKNCYPVAASLRVIDALQKSNKDFDMLMIPGSNPSYESYITRRTFDYFVKYLLEEEPPKEFDMDASFC